MSETKTYLEVPLNKEFTIIIGKYADNSGYQCAIEKITKLVDEPKTYSDLKIERFEEYKISKNELIERIKKGNDYFVWSQKGVNYYQKMSYDNNLGLTSDGVNYY